MERTIRLEIPNYLPPRELNPNGRASWQATYAAKNNQADEVISALSHLGIWPLFPHQRRPWYDERGFPWEKIAVKLSFYVKDNRRRDKDNFIASMKVGLDALQGRIITDDKDIVLIKAEFIKNNALAPMTVIEVTKVIGKEV